MEEPSGASTLPRGPPRGRESAPRGPPLGERKHAASPATERWHLVGAGRARRKEARGELAGWRRGASSLGKPGAGGGDEVGGWDRRDKERKEKKEKIKKS